MIEVVMVTNQEHNLSHCIPKGSGQGKILLSSECKSEQEGLKVCMVLTHRAIPQGCKFHHMNSNFSQGCRKMFCYEGAPVTHGCRGKDVSYTKCGNNTISFKLRRSSCKETNRTQSK